MILGVLMSLLVLIGGGPLWAASFSDDFNRPDGLVTSEYAYWNPHDSRAVRSTAWEMTSGSFFIKDLTGWSGIPDGDKPDAMSAHKNHSAVFRLTTTRKDFGDVEVSFALFNEGLSSTPATPPLDWDGVHVWLRYQNQEHLYYASINRRDNTVLIKKKIPGGPSNGGTYYSLSPSVPYPVPYNVWVSVRATVKNEADGTVSIALFINDLPVVSARDDGSQGGSPIRSPGQVGLRGDNCNFRIDNFIVKPLTP